MADSLTRGGSDRNITLPHLHLLYKAQLEVSVVKGLSVDIDNNYTTLTDTSNCTSTSAPASTSNLTTSECPFKLAIIRGVDLSYEREKTNRTCKLYIIETIH